jgi:hypothetical protein
MCWADPITSLATVPNCVSLEVDSVSQRWLLVASVAEISCAWLQFKANSSSWDPVSKKYHHKKKAGGVAQAVRAPN